MKAFSSTSHTYYKWDTWTQPELTSNRSSSAMWIEDPHLSGATNNADETEIATWGSTAMGDYNNIYYSMDSSTSNVFTLSSSNINQDDYIYQKYDVFDICFSSWMKITHIKVVCLFSSGHHCALRRVMVYGVNSDQSLGSKLFNDYGSNNKTTLEKDVTNTNPWKKIRVCLRPDWNNGSYSCQIKEVIITAEKAISGTSSDYNFYIDKDVYKAVYFTDYLTSKTFNARNEIQTWTVPAGVTKVHVDCVASKGADGEAGSIGGNGGRVQCDLNVTPGQSLYVIVGKIPETAATVSYNASDIRTNNSGITNTTSLNSRLIVAGGGGSGAWRADSKAGGAGGGLTGGTGTSGNYADGGTGGTQSAGGDGGDVHVSGSMWASYGGDGQLGLGGTSDNHSNHYSIGGVGGAGYYGGGGGAGTHWSNGNGAAGGGGGSSYTDSTYCSNVTHTQGYENGSGYITISAINSGDYITTATSYKLVNA